MTARWLVLFGFAISQSVNAGSVQVDLFENIPPGSEFELAGRQPVERYTENAFGFVRVPTKYSPNALALDLSTPYILRATFERDLPAGERQFRLRARGAAAFMVDGNVVAKTKPQPPNTSGDDPVPPPLGERAHSCRLAPASRGDSQIPGGPPCARSSQGIRAHPGIQRYRPLPRRATRSSQDRSDRADVRSRIPAPPLARCHGTHPH